MPVKPGAFNPTLRRKVGGPSDHVDSPDPLFASDSCQMLDGQRVETATAKLWHRQAGCNFSLPWSQIEALAVSAMLNVRRDQPRRMGQCPLYFYDEAAVWNRFVKGHIAQAVEQRGVGLDLCACQPSKADPRELSGSADVLGRSGEDEVPCDTWAKEPQEPLRIAAQKADAAGNLCCKHGCFLGTGLKGLGGPGACQSSRPRTVGAREGYRPGDDGRYPFCRRHCWPAWTATGLLQEHRLLC